MLEVTSGVFAEDGYVGVRNCAARIVDADPGGVSYRGRSICASCRGICACVIAGAGSALDWGVHQRTEREGRIRPKTPQALSFSILYCRVVECARSGRIPGRTLFELRPR
jgi:hypothetical protein